MVLWLLLPRAIAFPSHAQLQAANQALQQEIAERRQLEAELAEVRRRLHEHADAERLHLAQELHDEPLQELIAAEIDLQFLAPELATAAGQSRLDAVLARLKQVTWLLRNICTDLRPPVLVSFGLPPALRSFAQQVGDEQPGLEIVLDVEVEQHEVPERLHLGLYRIFQQALRNTLLHAQADQVSVRLERTDVEIVLEIRDNGRGFEMPARWIALVREGHFGLAGMAERAEALDGHFEISSTSGQGTTVRVIVPVGHATPQHPWDPQAVAPPWPSHGAPTEPTPAPSDATI